jgi:hypothetical protein
MSAEFVHDADEVRDPEREVEDNEPTGSIIWNYFKIAGVQSKRGEAKNVMCIFWDTVLLVAVPLELLPIFLVHPFSIRRKKMLKLAYQFV